MPATWCKLALCLCVLSTCGRSVSQNEHAHNIKLPETWQSAHAQQHVDDAWLITLNDQALVQLVQQALKNNLNLKAQAARWQQFESRARLAGADRRLQASAQVNASRRYQENDFGDDYTNSYSLGLNLSWEIDLWNKLNDRSQAAAFLADASLADYESLKLSIAASVAQSWYTCVLNHLQIQLLTETLKAWDTSINSAESRFQRGSITALDLQRLQQARNADAASLTQRRQQQQEQIRNLQLLLGAYPNTHIQTATALPTLAEHPASDQPSSLLNRRFDVRAAELRLQAQVKTVNAAEKDLLPSFRLSGELGYASDELKDVFEPASFFWNALAGLTAPLFQGGRLRETVTLRKAELDERIAVYGQHILEACRDVEVALDNERFIRQRIKEISASVVFAEKSHQQAEQQYLKGLINISDVLEIQRSLLTIKARLLNVQHALVSNRINLHLALGGDFQTSSNKATE